MADLKVFWSTILSVSTLLTKNFHLLRDFILFESGSRRVWWNFRILLSCWKIIFLWSEKILHLLSAESRNWMNFSLKVFGFIRFLYSLATFSRGVQNSYSLTGCANLANFKWPLHSLINIFLSHLKIAAMTQLLTHFISSRFTWHHFVPVFLKIPSEFD